MALSLSSRRQAQTSAAAWSGQQEAVQASLQARSRHLRLQKQHSFAEVSRANVGTVSSRNGRAAYLTRGLSVDRSCESLRQRIFTPKANRTGQHLRRTNSKLKDSSTFSALRKSSIDGTSSYVLTGATSTLLKSLDGKLKQVNSVLGGRNNGSSGAAADSKTKGPDTASQTQQPHLATTSDTNHSKTPCFKEAPKSDASRINLNIVLLHAIKTSTENEAINSEIESCSEAADTITIPASRSEHSTKLNAAPAATAQQRRAQFRSSRSTTINVSSSALPPLPPQVPAATVESTAANGGFSASPSLIVQRRPPLVRAMSAPVRSRPLDENSKGVLALNKRKLRRRKLLPRNASVCENSENAADDSRSDLILDIGGSRKKTPLARARSTIAVDVITLVSLVSSEGSDSEKEDSASTTPTGHSEPNSGRPSSLRKTGKSVSFQENYPPNFQLATKEYSHMIRRGSIAPLAARLRANRPPTAPPVSIFLNDSTDIDAMTTPTGKKASNSSTQPAEECKDAAQSDKENTSADLSSKPEEYTFPEYVRSIKERECWKLYRKMSVKGVNVTYDTILRGMLTPTEFRQVQKRRDLEEAKARALEEEKLAAEIPPPRISALERITQAHTKK